MKYPFLIRFLPLATAFVVVHILAEIYFVYWYFLWLDLPMHMWGGVLLVLALGALSELVSPRYRAFFLRPVTIAVFVLTVIILWEVLGVLLAGGFKVNWAIDTSSDIVFGILGALLGYWWNKRHIQTL